MANTKLERLVIEAEFVSAVAKNVRKDKDAIVDLGKTADKETKRIVRGARDAGEGFDVLGRAAKRAFLLIGGYTILRQAASDALAFRRAMAEVSTIAEEDAAAINALRGEVRDLASELGTDQVETARGLYEALSSELGDTADSYAFLREANELAVAGLGTSEESVRLLAASINAFGDDTLVASRNADIFFTAVDRGITRIPELSASLGRVLPIAAELGLGIDQVTAAVAALTLGGLSTAEAVTALRSALIAFLKHVDRGNDLFGEQNTIFNSAAIRTKGLDRALQDLVVAIGNDEEALTSLIGRVEGTQAVLALTGNQADSFRDILDDVETSTGKVDAAFRKIDEDAGRRFEKLINRLKIGASELAEDIIVLAEATDDLIRRSFESDGVDFDALDLPALQLANAIISEQEISLTDERFASLQRTLQKRLAEIERLYGPDFRKRFQRQFPTALEVAEQIISDRSLTLSEQRAQELAQRVADALAVSAASAGEQYGDLLAKSTSNALARVDLLDSVESLQGDGFLFEGEPFRASLGVALERIFDDAERISERETSKLRESLQAKQRAIASELQAGNLEAAFEIAQGIRGLNRVIAEEIGTLSDEGLRIELPVEAVTDDRQATLVLDSAVARLRDRIRKSMRELLSELDRGQVEAAAELAGSIDGLEDVAARLDGLKLEPSTDQAEAVIRQAMADVRAALAAEPPIFVLEDGVVREFVGAARNAAGELVGVFREIDQSSEEAESALERLLAPFRAAEIAAASLAKRQASEFQKQAREIEAQTAEGIERQRLLLEISLAKYDEQLAKQVEEGELTEEQARKLRAQAAAAAQVRLERDGAADAAKREAESLKEAEEAAARAADRRDAIQGFADETAAIRSEIAQLDLDRRAALGDTRALLDAELLAISDAERERFVLVARRVQEGELDLRQATELLALYRALTQSERERAAAAAQAREEREREDAALRAREEIAAGVPGLQGEIAQINLRIDARRRAVQEDIAAQRISGELGAQALASLEAQRRALTDAAAAADAARGALERLEQRLGAVGSAARQGGAAFRAGFLAELQDFKRIAEDDVLRGADLARTAIGSLSQAAGGAFDVAIGRAQSYREVLAEVAISIGRVAAQQALMAGAAAFIPGLAPTSPEAAPEGAEGAALAEGATAAGTELVAAAQASATSLATGGQTAGLGLLTSAQTAGIGLELSGLTAGFGLEGGATGAGLAMEIGASTAGLTLELAGAAVATAMEVGATAAAATLAGAGVAGGGVPGLEKGGVYRGHGRPQRAAKGFVARRETLLRVAEKPNLEEAVVPLEDGDLPVRLDLSLDRQRPREPMELDSRRPSERRARAGDVNVVLQISPALNLRVEALDGPSVSRALQKEWPALRRQLVSEITTQSERPLVDAIRKAAGRR